MALPYPEGKCYFRRSAINNPYGVNLEDPTQFYSHFLVEYVWNKPAYHGSVNANTRGGGHKFQRSGYKIVNGSWWNTDYGVWDRIEFMYGSRNKGIERVIAHALCENGNAFRDREKGDAYQYKIMPIPMPKPHEDQVYIDRLAFIRAIYIPVAFQASKDYQDLSTYVQIAFNQRNSINMLHIMDNSRRHLDEWRDVQSDRQTGLGVVKGWTLGLDIRGLIRFLTIPHEKRQGTIYTHTLIYTLPSSSIQTRQINSRVPIGADLDYLYVTNHNFGTSFAWTEGNYTSWHANFLKNVLSIGLGFVPVIGPMLAVGFPLAFTAIAEPKNFVKDLRNALPQVDLGMHFAELIEKEASATRKYLAPTQKARSLEVPSLARSLPVPGDATGQPEYLEITIGAEIIVGTNVMRQSNEAEGEGRVVLEIPVREAKSLANIPEHAFDWGKRYTPLYTTQN